MEVAATTRKRVKRNHPCEACRLQRRKCSPQPDGGPCQRCRLMKRECVYKRSAVPSGEVYDPTEDELRLLEEVDIVEEELEDLETEMLEITARKGVKGESGNGGSCSDSPPLLTSSPLNDASSSNPTSKGCLPLFSPHSMGQDSLPLYSDPVDDAVVSMKGHVVHPWEDHRKLEALNRFNWTVTLRSGRLQIRTNIRNMQDLVNIALNNYENMHDFDDPNNIISPTYLTNQRGGPVLRVTAGHNSLGDATFKVVKMAGRNTVTIMKYHNVKVRLERHAMTCLVETFFLCVNRVHPLIHRPTFERLFWLADDPASSALTCALCAVMTMRDCEHSLVVGTYPSPISRQMMGEHFAMRARELLEEQFDTPSLGTIVGLLCMILYRILSLEVSKAFQYSGLALQMGRVLVRQLDHSGPDPSKYTTEGWAEREMFKRTFFFLLTTVLRFHLLLDRISPYEISPVFFDIKGLGYPEPLPDEDAAMCRAAKAQAYSLMLGNIQFQDRRFAVASLIGKLTNTLPVDVCSEVERSMNMWYDRLEPEFRLTRSMFQLVDPAALARGDFHPTVVVLNINLYNSWQLIHAHFLPRSHATHAPTEENAQGEENPTNLSLRSLTICVKSSAIVLQLAEWLYNAAFCYFDPHMLLQACDVHHKLSVHPNPQLAETGRRNLARGLRILKAALARYNRPVDSVGVERHVSKYVIKLEESLIQELESLGIVF